MLNRLRILDRALVTCRQSALQGTDELWPCALDLSELPRITEFVQGGEAGMETTNVSCTATIDHYVEQWKAQRETTLVGLLKEDLAASNQQLTAAACPTALFPASIRDTSALFWCRHCQELVSSVSAMTHGCCYRFQPSWRNYYPECIPWIDGAYTSPVVEEGDLFGRACAIHSCSFLPWSHVRLVPCTDKIRTLWTTLGIPLDITAVSGSEMNDARLGCGLCSQYGTYMVVMGWRQAVRAQVDEFGLLIP